MFHAHIQTFGIFADERHINVAITARLMRVWVAGRAYRLKASQRRALAERKPLPIGVASRHRLQGQGQPCLADIIKRGFGQGIGLFLICLDSMSPCPPAD